MSILSDINKAYRQLAEEDEDDDEENDEKTDSEREEEREKGGGKRKRRSAYSSGRKEKMGLRNGKLYDTPNTSSKSDRDNNKRSISRTSAASNHRWRER